ncbi:hypothetical protein [Nitrobacter sp. JJSN]|uniref:hypothetical protein n=1 Tax=Nitrobacter sp. JJSN TaxID=3453033 RepID=UPI003F75FE0D
MRLVVVVVVVPLLFLSGVSFAEDASPPATPSANNGVVQSSSTDPGIDMSQVAVGDHWSYDVIDDITGKVKQRVTSLVTDVSEKEIATRAETEGSSRYGEFIYDKSWNIIKRGDQRFSPNDGGGIQDPLEVNKTWSIRADRIDSKGHIWRKTGTSRASEKETITTKAGRFDAFVIETKFTARNSVDPTRKAAGSVKMWYSPRLDHWVKRTTALSENGHTVQKETVELTGFGRRKP